MLNLLLVASLSILVFINITVIRILMKQNKELINKINDLEIRLPAGEISEGTIRETERITSKLKSLSQKQ